jgi:aspartate kinase
MIVCKFGGSSVASAAGIARVAGIVRARRAARPIVVVSAMGKTTRRLLDCAEEAAAGSLAEAIAGCEELRRVHWHEAAGVVPPAGRARLAALLEECFGELRALLVRLAKERRLTPRDADDVAGRGEVLASEILALALPGFGVEAAWIDARRVVVTDDLFTRARPLYAETNARLRAAVLPVVEAGRVPVLGGYVGATRDGAPTTLGFEGSDFSAAIVGAAVGAGEVQIWTDVDGILTADPRLVPAARVVPALSFGEALELACSGAKKPHPGTLGPASRAGVPIRVLNSFAAGAADTTSVESRDDGSAMAGDAGRGTLIGGPPCAGGGPHTGAPGVKSLACRTNDLLVQVQPRGPAAEFVAAVLGVIEELRPALLVLRLGEEGAQLALNHGSRLDEVRRALAAAGVVDRPEDVGVLHGRAVVSLIADDFATDAGLVERTLAAARDLQPRLVIAGAAAPVVRCLVEADDLPAVAGILHARLFAAAAAEPAAARIGAATTEAKAAAEAAEAAEATARMHAPGGAG